MNALAHSLEAAIASPMPPAVAIALSVTHPTGDQLADAIEAEAARRGTTAFAMTRVLYPSPRSGKSGWKLQQLRLALQPSELTVQRIRALLRGEPVPPPAARSTGQAPSAAMAERCREQSEMASEKLERDRARCALARDARRGGETIADAIRRCGREMAEAEAEESGVGLTRQRRVPGLDEAQWAAIRQLATREGSPIGDMLAKVVAAGLMAVGEDLDEAGL